MPGIPTSPRAPRRRTSFGLHAWVAALAAATLTSACVNSERPGKRERTSPVEAWQPPRVALPAGAPAPSAKAPAADATKAKAKAKPLQVTFSHCQRADCPITLTFSQPMVRKLRRGLAPKAFSPTEAQRQRETRPLVLAFSPALRGSFSWTSPKTLVFRPRRGALPHGHRVQLQVSRAVPLAGERSALREARRGAFRAPYFEAADKVASWPVQPKRPRLVAILDNSDATIGRSPLFVLYDQPVRPTWVAKSARFVDNDNRRHRPRVFRPTSIRRIWRGRIDLRHVVAVQARHRLVDGDSLEVQLPSWRSGSLTVFERELTTRTRFRVTALALARSSRRSDRTGGGQRTALWASWRFSFSSPAHTHELRKRLRVRPKPKSLSLWGYGDSAQLQLHLEPGRRYTLTLPAGTRDKVGNRLPKTIVRRFRAQDLAPELKLPKTPQTLELRRPRIALSGLNLGRTHATLHRFAKVKDFIDALRYPGRPCAQRAGTTKLDKTHRDRHGGSINAIRERSLPLRAITRGEAMLACLQLEAAGRGSEGEGGRQHQSQLLQLTDLGITAKLSADRVYAWTTRLSTGAPAAGATLILYDPHGKPLAKATADQRGLASLPGTGLTQRGGLARRGYLLASIGTKDRALLDLRSDRLAQPWQYGLKGEAKGHRPLTASLFTDRGLYRPGETVYLKIIARDPATLTVPAARNLTLVVKGPRGDTVFDRKLDLDDLGAAHAELVMPKTSSLGRYSVTLRQGKAQRRLHFRVEEYRVPTFKVRLRAAAELEPRNRVQALVSARYLHGGTLAGRKVRYQVTRQPADFEPRGYEAFRFGTRTKGEVNKLQVVVSGEGRLDGSSRLPLRFAAMRPPGGPTRYQLEATVTDVDQQTQSARLAKIVHPSRFYLGLEPPKVAILAPGAQLKVPLVALTPTGRVLPGVLTDVRLERLDHHSTARLRGGHARRENRALARVVERCRRRTRRGVTTCIFRPRRAGRYRVRAVARDGLRRVVSSFLLTMPGSSSIAWPRYDHERITVLTDKPSYRPGDVAKLMIQSPFRRAKGLLTLERGGVLEQRLFEIKGDAPALKVPIRAGHAPNVFASVVLLRGRTHHRTDATGFETGAPAFRLGYAQLKVLTPRRRLRPQISAPSVARPGQTVAIDLQLPPGSASSRSAATVMVVDEAVLGLTGHRTPRPLAQLLAPRPLGVRTASSRVELANALRARREAIFPGGGGGYDDDEERRGEVEDKNIRLRRDFATTALFAPAVRFDKRGRAQVKVTLPDNLTAFRLMAVVYDDAGRAGSAERSLRVRQPLMVRAVAPRFVHKGDLLWLRARVENGTTEVRRVRVSASFRGLSQRGGEAAVKTVSVPPLGHRQLAYQLRVDADGEVHARFSAKSGDVTDAVESKLPVADPGNRRREVVSTVINTRGEVSVDLPAKRLPGSTQLSVLASSSSLTRLKGAVDYLMGYPHGCIEQTTSRAYPLVVLEDLLPEIGVQVDTKKLKSYRDAGIKRLLSFQTKAGGLSYWPGGKSPHAFGTAFGLTALIAARARGYTIDERVFRRAGDYLEKVLRAGGIKEQMPHGGMADGDTRAFIAMTLGRLRRPQGAVVEQLWRNKAKLGGFGLAFLATAVAEGPRAQRTLLGPVLAELRQRAVEKPQEAYFGGKRRRGWSMGSPLRAHATALMAFAKSVEVNGAGNFAAKLLTGLLARQRRGLWGNTQENVFGIMAVATAVGPRVGKPAAFDLSVGGKTIPKGRFERLGRAAKQVVLSEKGSELKLPKAGKATPRIIIDNRGATPLKVRLRADYAVPLVGKELAAQNRGFRIRRIYETPAGRPLDPRKIRLGSLVRVRLLVTTKKSFNYVAISDRLPAGLEPINSALATSARARGGKPSRALLKGIALLSFRELKERGAAFYVDALPSGEVELAYLARATVAGRFLRPAARGEAMYDPAAEGRSATDWVVIRR